jgi:hypothetical protein
MESIAWNLTCYKTAWKLKFDQICTTKPACHQDQVEVLVNKLHSLNIQFSVLKPENNFPLKV